MRLRAFDLVEPAPELDDPHAFTIIRPWIDVGSAGSLTLSCLEDGLGSSELARLARPSNFFDLTRYRPNLRREEGRTEVDIPNALATYSKQQGDRDSLFLHLPEPHMMAETYVDSIVELLKAFSVKRYCLIGSVYDMVPHTRPLLVTGRASSLALQNELDLAKVVSSDYRGPTTILHLLGQKAVELGMETLSLVVHLPNYLGLDEDYRGVARLMEILNSLKGLNLLDACLDSDGVIIPGKSTLMIADSNENKLMFLLSIINSHIAFFYLKERYSASSYNLGTSFTKAMINNLPLPSISEGKQKPFITLIHQILAVTKYEDYLSNPAKQAQVKEYECQIDQMVYELYGLTPEEIAVVEGKK